MPERPFHRRARRRVLRIVAVALAAAGGWWVAGPGGGGEGVAEVSHPHEAELKHDDGSWRYTNALIDETSPYLLQHAHNPVDWRPWGEAAFAEARERQVPIFLSIGYSTCYWCHVMERQVFEDPAIARQMNERFVCIKVDREERPDVDNLYMTATQLLTGSGGWPMSVFLTPPPPENDDDAAGPLRGPGGPPQHQGLLPFWAGTYIPPEPMHGRPSFPQVMEALTAAWNDQRAEVIEQARRVAAAVEQQLAQASRPGPVTPDTVAAVADALMQRYDPEHAGFSGPQGPKFPTPVQPALLLELQRTRPDARVRRAVDHTLARMARGGMYDQVGGGFHRYSVDGRWLVPHFEKMLYDNGQLLELYAEAYAADPDGPNAALYARVMRETARYLLREMRDETGALWSAQDAEVNAREGGNYVWTADQVREALAGGDDAAGLTGLALTMYGLDRGPNFTDPHPPEGTSADPVNVLYLPEPLAEIEGHGDAATVARKRDRINAALLNVRDRREQPATDDKVLTGWNGLAIAGLAEAGTALGEPWMSDAARDAADAVLSHMSMPDGGLFRTMRGGRASIPAFLEDYAFFVHGLLALHRAHPESDRRYLDEAVRLTAYAEQHFAARAGVASGGGGASGGYYDTLAGQSDLFVRAQSTDDGAVPSGTSVMLHVLIDLYGSTGERAYLDRAVTVLRGLAPSLERAGLGMTHAAEAAARLLAAAPPGVAEALRAPAASPAAAPPFMRPEHGVTATAEALSTGRYAYRVTVVIPAGLHLNANPAGDGGLIPTTITVDGVKLDVRYPEGEMKRYPFAESALPVYEGKVTLEVTAAGPVEALTLHYQACSDTMCFAPAEMAVPVE